MSILDYKFCIIMLAIILVPVLIVNFAQHKEITRLKSQPTTLCEQHNQGAYHDTIIIHNSVVVPITEYKEITVRCK